MHKEMDVLGCQIPFFSNCPTSLKWKLQDCIGFLHRNHLLLLLGHFILPISHLHDNSQHSSEQAEGALHLFGLAVVALPTCLSFMSTATKDFFTECSAMKVGRSLVYTKPQGEKERESCIGMFQYDLHYLDTSVD